MGSSSSKGTGASADSVAPPPTYDEAAVNRLMQQAFREGVEEATMDAMLMMESQERQHVVLGTAGCLATFVAASMFFTMRMRWAAEEAGRALAAEAEKARRANADLISAKESVSRLTAAAETHKQVLRQREQELATARHEASAAIAKVTVLERENVTLMQRTTSLQQHLASQSEELLRITQRHGAVRRFAMGAGGAVGVTLLIASYMRRRRNRRGTPQPAPAAE